ncbi:Tetracyclin repressor, C-terminal all-alpha domain [Goodfellowiella coeruleoviolacea]|uniref:Tetracyclin repressor, C-terminal all-alpha domain n=1 Tax=Goodfellowiella coeruleoviolacea TaxID=334858 RepID=A0AAE3KIP0_9PSEU|nr:Tetracyclin repressor, C-terminal all-alpha domain [Goodfellowiella coeruleoviolacea]
MHQAPGFADIDAVLSAVEAVNAYTIGAIRGEVTVARAERATGMDEHQWQRVTGPYLTRTLATGRYPTLAKVVHDARHLDPDATFTAGLEYLLDGIAARHTR